MKQIITSLLAIGLLGAVALAEPMKFDFKDPKGVNNATFKLDAPLEAISGSANGIVGTVMFDPEKPAATKGTIIISTTSLRVGNSMMQEHLLSDKWMDAAKHGEIIFEARELGEVKTAGDTTSAVAVGKLTIKGVTKEVVVPVKLTYLKGKLGERVPKMKGDLLVIRANFKIKRSDYDINPGQYEDKVSNEIELGVSIAGAAPTP